MVASASGRPVAGALVVATRQGARETGPIVAAGSGGEFSFQLEDGAYALTATSDEGVAAYHPPERPAGPVTLTLGDASEGFTVSGHVRSAAAATGKVRVTAARESDVEGDVFVAEVGPGGQYRLRLPRALAHGYLLQAEAPGAAGVRAGVGELRDQEIDLDLYVPAPLPADVLEWVGRAAAPLDAVQAGRGFADLGAVDAIVGDARLVGLGEATHGTREFFQIKHRLIEYLVVKKGFRAVAFEAGRAEARRVNEYVLGGRGTAAAALRGLRYWTWDTEEITSLVEWMRTYNADPRHAAKVQFLGVDMDFTPLAARNVRAYLERVDPAFLRARPPTLELFEADDAAERWVALSAEARAALRVAAEATVARLDERRALYARGLGPARFREARDDARSVAQWAVVHAGDRAAGDFGFSQRDVAMAENLDRALAEGGPREKIVLWAHNGHVGFALPPLVSMGELLRKEHGAGYVAVGLLFGRGKFRALGAPRSAPPRSPQEVELGPASEADLTTPFARAKHPLALLDLRRAPAGVVREWFAAPHPVRDIGVRFIDEARASALHAPARRYDALLFVAETTASRPNAAAPD